MGIIGFIIVALVAGLLARLLVPGRDPLSIPATILLGAIGSFVGGVLGVVLTNKTFGDFSASGIFGSIIGAIIALLLYRKFGNRLKR